jgi:hypothetical protein
MQATNQFDREMLQRAATAWVMVSWIQCSGYPSFSRLQSARVRPFCAERWHVARAGVHRHLCRVPCCPQGRPLAEKKIIMALTNDVPI